MGAKGRVKKTTSFFLCSLEEEMVWMNHSFFASCSHSTQRFNVPTHHRYNRSHIFLPDVTQEHLDGGNLVERVTTLSIVLASFSRPPHS